MPTLRRPASAAWLGLGMLGLAFIAAYRPERLQGAGVVLMPVLCVGAVLVLRRLWTQPPAVTMCAAIVLAIFSNAWSQIGLGGLPLDRLLLLFVLAQIALRSPGAASVPPIRVRGVHLLMALVGIYLLGSAALAGTLDDRTTVLSIVDGFGLAPYLAFLAAPAIFAGERERSLLLATLVGLGLYLGVTAVFEVFGPHSLVFPRYIALVDAADVAQRVNGPFQSSVAEGCAAFACAVASLIAFVRWRGRSRRLLAATAAVLCAFATFATLQRGVWTAAVAAILVAGLCTRWGRRWLLPALAIGALAIGAVLVASPTLSERASTRASYQRSVWDRQNQTSAGLRMVEAEPLLGFGLGRYREDSLEYFRQPADYPMTGHLPRELLGEPAPVLPLHNLYLAYAVELGLLGMLLWLAALLWGVGGAIVGRAGPEIRSWRLGLLALLVFFCVVTAVNPSQPPFVTLLLWTWAGLAMAAEDRRVQGLTRIAAPGAAPGGDPPVRALGVA